MAIVIKFTTEDEISLEVPLFGEKITIGRSSKCDVIIKDLKVSSTHCTLSQNTNGLIIFKDLGSTNGSFLNEQKITTPHYLKINETIRIGKTLISIDESKLSTAEKTSIGTTTLAQNTKIEVTEFKEPETNTTNKIKGVGVNKKEIKKKTVELYKSNVLIEAEESSGNTKFLKIEKPSKKKKN